MATSCFSCKDRGYPPLSFKITVGSHRAAYYIYRTPLPNSRCISYISNNNHFKLQNVDVLLSFINSLTTTTTNFFFNHQKYAVLFHSRCSGRCRLRRPHPVSGRRCRGRHGRCVHETHPHHPSADSHCCSSLGSLPRRCRRWPGVRFGSHRRQALDRSLQQGWLHDCWANDRLAGTHDLGVWRLPFQC